MIEEDLYSQLSTYEGLTALVKTRIYPLVAPQTVQVPFCVYTKISNERQYSHGGFSNLERVRMQVSCYAETYAGTRAVVAQVIAAIAAWPAVNAKVQAALQENEVDFYDDGTQLYHLPVDFFIWYGI